MTTLQDFDDKNVAEKFLEPPTTHCRVCGSSKNKEKEFIVQKNPQVILQRCPDCGVASVDRVPKLEYIKELYNPQRYSSSLMENHSLSKRLAKMIAENIKFDKNKNINILDYGGNEGNLSKQLMNQLIQKGFSKSNIHITVIDFYTHENRDNIHFIHVDEMEELDSKFNILLVSAVLEHLVDVGDTLKKLLNLLQPGALIYGRTPYEVPLHRIYKGYNIRWPRHLHDMGPQFWENLLPNLGYEGKIIESTPSIVETTISQKPLFTIAAHTLKAPSYVECKWLKPIVGYRNYLWKLVGGWQAFIIFNGKKS